MNIPLYDTARKGLTMQDNPIICACGCGLPLTPKTGHSSQPKRYLKGHSSISQPKPRPTIVCACGCGESFVPTRFRATRPQRYAPGHQSRRLRKPADVIKVLSGPRRQALYEATGNRCEQCGRTMEEQIVLFGRRLEIHHKNHDHNDNRDGNHQVLCTACHNEHSLAVRDEEKKSATWRQHRAEGRIRMWSEGKTKETDERVAKMAAAKTRQELTR